MDEKHTNIIECVDISKNFGDKKVLSTMNFHAKENEFVVILGPGQSGKSTLMRLIAGFEAPTTGHVYVNGEEVDGPSDKLVSYSSATPCSSGVPLWATSKWGQSLKGSARKNAVKWRRNTSTSLV